MTDVNHDLSVLTSQLQNSHVDDQGLSFLGRTLKLNNEKDGKFYFSYSLYYLLISDFFIFICFFVCSLS